MTKNPPKIIVVVGPTASGKSELAVRLANTHQGEIISADSRQVYKGMDIGSGKVEGLWTNGIYEYKGVLHYLIDVANPKSQYSVSKFKRESDKAIKQIIRRGKVPILCGGTGHWIDAVVFDESLPAVKPNPKLRKELEKFTAENLYEKLKKLDPDRASEIDPKNPRRLVRALEIVMSTGKPVPKINRTPKYETLWLGIKPEQETLHAKIQKRLKQRLKQGMLEEVKRLHDQGLSWKKLESFGLEYKFAALHLQGKITYEEMFERLLTAIKQYSKRQLTWWKRNNAIHWSEDPKELLSLAKKLL